MGPCHSARHPDVSTSFRQSVADSEGLQKSAWLQLWALPFMWKFAEDLRQTEVGILVLGNLVLSVVHDGIGNVPLPEHLVLCIHTQQDRKHTSAVGVGACPNMPVL